MSTCRMSDSLRAEDAKYSIITSHFNQTEPFQSDRAIITKKTLAQTSLYNLCYFDNDLAFSNTLP